MPRPRLFVRAKLPSTRANSSASRSRWFARLPFLDSCTLVSLMSCIFCKIVAGEIPSTAVFQDARTYAFADINAKAPVHILIVPREHIGSLSEAGVHHGDLLGHLLWTAAEIARAKGLGNGYRVVINSGPDGGQTVDHLHLHLLGGRPMAWPPG